MGTLPEDASPSAFLEKFSGLGDLGDIKVEGEKSSGHVRHAITYNDKVKKSIIYFQTVRGTLSSDTCDDPASTFRL